jgi:hypothetical protein
VNEIVAPDKLLARADELLHAINASAPLAVRFSPARSRASTTQFDSLVILRHRHSACQARPCVPVTLPHIPASDRPSGQELKIDERHYRSRVRPALSLIGTVAGVWAARIAAEHLGSRYQNWRESRRAGTIGHQLLKHWTGTTEIDIRDGRDVTPPPGAPRSPRPTRPLEIVQIDHLLADIMVVDEVQRDSMGRPWVCASGAS